MKQVVNVARLGSGLCVSHCAPAPYKIEDNGINEDALLTHEVDDKSVVLTVADGAGGHPEGHKASALVIESLMTSLASPGIRGDSLREAVLTALETCNKSLLERGRGSLSTAAVVEVHGQTIRPYHVGDSSILVVGQRGRIKYQSVSHSTVGFGIEAGLMESDAAHQHDERHWVLNFVGTPEMRIELGAPLALSRFDTLMICSDAVTDNLPIDEVCESIRKGSLQQALQKLVDKCETAMNADNGRPDDLSIILYRRAD